mmetsp:Transcript_91401/g.258397  ORF Transcript_91401/g.258397 Transcript_91401/m.258397 type:complete len:340 (-) Transcript_91401:508-1527(-)
MLICDFEEFRKLLVNRGPMNQDRGGKERAHERRAKGHEPCQRHEAVATRPIGPAHRGLYKKQTGDKLCGCEEHQLHQLDLGQFLHQHVHHGLGERRGELVVRQQPSGARVAAEALPGARRGAALRHQLGAEARAPAAADGLADGVRAAHAGLQEPLARLRHHLVPLGGQDLAEVRVYLLAADLREAGKGLLPPAGVGHPEVGDPVHVAHVPERGPVVPEERETEGPQIEQREQHYHRAPPDYEVDDGPDVHGGRAVLSLKPLLLGAGGQRLAREPRDLHGAEPVEAQRGEVVQGRARHPGPGREAAVAARRRLLRQRHQGAQRVQGRPPRPSEEHARRP